MDTSRICKQCQKPVPEGAPEGLCPECLAKVALGSEPGMSGARVPPEPADLAKQFPQLEILELVGMGGMGMVYKARQPKLDRFVALKIMPIQSDRGAAFADRFGREARALARLNHSGIVAVYDYGQTIDFYYFVMEYVDGMNLRQLLEREPVSPRQALGLVVQICTALQYAHDENIVHRDIKPANILINKNGQAKIADFGLAKLLGNTTDANLTETQTIMGTMNYMAPEQREKPLEVDHRADIYSLGVVLYEMLTGEVPMGHFDPPSKKVQIDVRLDEVVLRALDREPSRRYQKASEVRTGVETIAATMKARSPWPVLSNISLTAGSLAIGLCTDVLLQPDGGGWSRFSWPVAIIAALCWSMARKVWGGIRYRDLSPDFQRRLRQRILGAFIVAAVAYTVLFMRTSVLLRHASSAKFAESFYTTLNIFAGAAGLFAAGAAAFVLGMSRRIYGDFRKSLDPEALAALLKQSRLKQAQAGAWAAWNRYDVQILSAGALAGVIALMAPFWKLPANARQLEREGLMAAMVGDLGKEYDVAEQFAYGRNVPQNFAEAMKWYRKAADAGYWRAQLGLGGLYEFGEGVPANYGEAAKWYRKAADAGSATGMMVLGYHYETGHGVPQDYSEAAKWYRKAADTGDLRAAFKLARQYDTGQGVHQDYDEAAKWYRKVGDEEALNAVARIVALKHHGPADYITNQSPFTLVNSVDNETSHAGGPVWSNSLGMRFTRVPGTQAWFSVWDTRVQDFAAFAEDTGYQSTTWSWSGRHLKRDGNGWMSGHWISGGWKNPELNRGPAYPACGLSWIDAHAFCHWLTETEHKSGLLKTDLAYRLPAEEEWFVVFGSTQYPWGNEWPPPANAGNYAGWTTTPGAGEEIARTTPVGSFRADSFGLYDVGGNVWQWSEDLFGPKHTDGVLRGGAWNSSSSAGLLSSNHEKAKNDDHYEAYGFRCVIAADLTDQKTGGGAPQDYAEVRAFPQTLSSIITNNLPANTVIINISATQHGAANCDGPGQSLWHQPFYTGGATHLLEYSLAPGTYSFHVINPDDAARLFPALTAGQTNQIFTGWSFNSPWLEDYLVFDAAAATNSSLAQIFDGASDTDYGSAIDAYNGGKTRGALDKIRAGPLGRAGTKFATLYNITTNQTLIFAVGDFILNDNHGGVSLVIHQEREQSTAEAGTGADAENDFRTGYNYEQGIGVKKNLSEAVKWFRKAAEAGSANAQFSLGFEYEFGRGLNQDFGEAVKWYRKAAEGGHYGAGFNLGFQYEHGRGVPQDYAEAAKWYRKDAESGYDRAENALGSLYEQGFGVEKDYSEALYWYRKAAQGGLAEANGNVSRLDQLQSPGDSYNDTMTGFKYDQGNGVTQDYGEAAKWFRKGAEAGNALAQFWLGEAYAFGRGVREDFAEAVKWHRKSAESGNAQGEDGLGFDYEHGRGVGLDYAEAAKWYRKAAEAGFTLSQLRLANLYENGLGGPKDVNEAVNWYRKAANAGDSAGRENLARLLTQISTDKAGGNSASPEVLSTVSFDSVVLQDVLQALGKQAGLNIMFDPAIPGQKDADGTLVLSSLVTAKWKNVTAPQALAALLDNYGWQMKNETAGPIVRLAGVPLTDAAAALAMQAGLNIQFDPRLTKTPPSVTMEWKNVTARQALKALLNNWNLEATQLSGNPILRLTYKNP